MQMIDCNYILIYYAIAVIQPITNYDATTKEVIQT